MPRLSDPATMRDKAEECRVLAEAAADAGDHDLSRMLTMRAEMQEGWAVIFTKSRALLQRCKGRFWGRERP